jgi:hypothetical protein
MAEVFLCQTCHQRLDLKSDEYVVTNKATARTKSPVGVFACAMCRRSRRPPGDERHSIVRKSVSTSVEEHISGMDAAALRRLGLQRDRGSSPRLAMIAAIYARIDGRR